MHSSSDPIYIIHHIPKTGGVSLRTWLAQHLGFQLGLIHYGVAGELFCMQHRLPFIEQMTADQLYQAEVVMGHYVTEATADFFPERSVRRLIVLREPAKRLVSQYNHAMIFWCQGMGRDQINFYEWFERHAVKHYNYKDAIREKGLTPELSFQSQAPLGPNYMARFISQNFHKDEWLELSADECAARVNALLESFWCVGLTERLNDFAARLGVVLDIPLNIGHENRGQLRAVYLEPDNALIQFIREHNQVDYLVYEYWKRRWDAGY